MQDEMQLCRSSENGCFQPAFPVSQSWKPLSGDSKIEKPETSFGNEN